MKSPMALTSSMAERAMTASMVWGAMTLSMAMRELLKHWLAMMSSMVAQAMTS
jgi:hypothetical protein